MNGAGLSQDGDSPNRSYAPTRPDRGTAAGPHRDRFHRMLISRAMLEILFLISNEQHSTPRESSDFGEGNVDTARLSVLFTMAHDRGHDIYQYM